MHAVLVTILALVFVGCASVTGGPRSALEPPRDDVVAGATETAAPATAAPAISTPATETPATETPATAADTAVLPVADYQLVREEDAPSAAALLLAQRTQTDTALSAAPGDGVDEEYDPWEPFNERMFEFNRRLDRYILKPVAKAYNVVMPDRVQVMISNGFDNISFVPRMMNSIFQGKLDGAAREFGRFLFNSTIGVGGLFDVAKMEGIEKSREDFGQTLGFYGVGAGPYLIVPFLEPLTVRDGIGKAVDGVMDPLSYFVPFFYTRLLMKVEEIVNDRSLNLELFQGFEESVIDMYSAVRHGYLKRREKLIRE
jgi:phospholipid-binding lipoprotein MlaA